MKRKDRDTPISTVSLHPTCGPNPESLFRRMHSAEVSPWLVGRIRTGQTGQECKRFNTTSVRHLHCFIAVSFNPTPLKLGWTRKSRLSGADGVTVVTQTLSNSNTINFYSTSSALCNASFSPGLAFLQSYSIWVHVDAPIAQPTDRPFQGLHPENVGPV